MAVKTETNKTEIKNNKDFVFEKTNLDKLTN